MKLYNANTDKIVNKKVIKTGNAIYFVNKLTEIQLNSLGYYKVSFISPPDRRYYTYTETRSLVDNVYTNSYTPIDRNVSEVRVSMIKDLGETSNRLGKEATIVTGLGFDVKASRDNLDDFERGSNRGVLEVRDTLGNKHTVSQTEIAQISVDIETNGMVLYDTYWNKFDEINAFQTVSECVLYEATPYEATVDVIDESTLEPTGVTEVVTRYKNNVKEW